MQQTSGQVNTKTQEGILWVSNALEERAGALDVAVQGFEWQLNPTGTESDLHAFILIGKRGKRVVKLFTATELEQCLSDRQLQSHIHHRLTRMLNFLGGHAEQQSACNKRKACP
jgi:hypothetical protein